MGYTRRACDLDLALYRVQDGFHQAIDGEQGRFEL
jgi:hypothetical protein